MHPVARITASRPPERRRFMTWIGTLGLAAAALPRTLLAVVAKLGKIDKRSVAEAEKVAGLAFTEAERDLMIEGLGELRESYAAVRAVPLPNSVPPALVFDPRPPGWTPVPDEAISRHSRAEAPAVPEDLEQLAFESVLRLGQLVRTRKVTSTQLTRMYLKRLKRLDGVLHCVTSLTEELALKQAERADKEIASGFYRGPLHGIPWGAKDLLATSKYRTTWGAEPYRDQYFDQNAAVVERLEEAGAVLVAKLTLGALAFGDVWYGGKTRNPWSPEEGSSGSSAGPAAAVAAGLVGFAIGSETWGSIVSPATRCGATGLRPTFGRVSRHGAMALSWSMDKIGPMARTVEDCALVLEAIAGRDPRDPTTVELPFAWDAERDPRALRVGFLKGLFEQKREEEESEGREHDLAVLAKLRGEGFQLVPLKLPDLPVDALSFLLTVEAAAAFDELTRTDRDDLLTRQTANAWPNLFRQARLVPAVEYVQANRVRTLWIRRMAEIFAQVDVYVAPSFLGDNLLLTNLTGHPAVVLPNGFTREGTPTSITFTGNLYGEGNLLTVARAYQEATDFHLRHPAL